MGQRLVECLSCLSTNMASFSTGASMSINVRSKQPITIGIFATSWNLPTTSTISSPLGHFTTWDTMISLIAVTVLCSYYAKLWLSILHAYLLLHDIALHYLTNVGLSEVAVVELKLYSSLLDAVIFPQFHLKSFLYFRLEIFRWIHIQREKENYFLSGNFLVFELILLLKELPLRCCCHSHYFLYLHLFY
jgi:hypothetical protein